MIDIIDLLHKRWKVVQEGIPVVVHDDCKVDAMLPACQQCFAVISADRFAKLK
jgi:hypothetical protein